VETRVANWCVSGEMCSMCTWPAQMWRSCRRHPILNHE